MVTIHPFGDENEEDNLLDYLQGHWFSNVSQDRPQLFRNVLTNMNLDNVHSMQINAKWCDQGWGGRRSKLLFVRSIKTPSQRSLEDDDEIICKSPVAGHSLEDLTISIPIVESNHYKYSIWAHVGGAGGREIRIASLSIRYLVYADNFANE